MKEPGALLASGRDCDIFEYGHGLVLRRARDGRPIEYEARIMRYLHERGYPVPAIEEISEDGTRIVMERVDGLSMVDAIGKAPWSVRRQARLLADLHLQLHEIAAPEDLRPSPVGQGDRVVHMDLHPLNVIIAARGPVVIDWTGGSKGNPDVDVAVAWLLMSSGEIPGSGLVVKLMGLGRSLLVNGFLARFDRTTLTRVLRSVVEWKVSDPHMSESEVASMWKLVESSESKL